MSSDPNEQQDSDPEPQDSAPPEPVEPEQSLSPNSSRRRPRILSREEALAGLSQLPTLIITGTVSVPQANSMRGILNSVIQAHDRSPSHNQIPPQNTGVIVQNLRQHPELADALAPFLSPEIIDRLMEGYQDE